MPRLAMKTLTYSVMHLVVAVAVAYALTRDWRVALAIGIIEPMVQTVAYAIHERAWTRFSRKRQARVSTEAPAPAEQTQGASAYAGANGSGAGASVDTRA